MEALVVRPFCPADQDEVKRLILAGLVDHWGVLDPTKNPDLDDIPAAYAGATFLVARLAGCIVGTGALVPRGEGVGEIVRMSVARALRRRGVGRMILARLVKQARRDGLRQVVLETTATWGEVIAFYLDYGFCITHESGGDVYFALDLEG